MVRRHMVHRDMDMIRMHIARGLVLTVITLGNMAVLAEAQTARQTVEAVTDHMLSLLMGNRGQLKADPRQTYALIDDYLIPHFDFMKMGRLVLGKYWRKSTEQQTAMFIEQFRQLLLRTYGTALVEYSGQKVNFLACQLFCGLHETDLRCQR